MSFEALHAASRTTSIRCSITAVLLAAFGPTVQGCAGSHNAQSEPSETSAVLNERTTITVLGPADLIDGLTVKQMTRTTDSAPGPGDTQVVVFRSNPEESWSSSFRFSHPSTNSSLTVQPWICSGQPRAFDSLRSGFAATEGRTIEIDSSGHFWTNGRLGYPFLSTCSWASTSATGGGVAANQDGPGLCTEEARRGTRVELLDGSGKVLSTPSVCVARFGEDPTSPSGAAVNVSLVREQDDGVHTPMEFWLYHCVGAEQSPPFSVSASDFVQIANSTRCQEKAILSLGTVGATKPPVLNAVSGSWNVISTGPQRDTGHSSDIEFTFLGPEGQTYVVQGHIELPQVLF